MSTDEMNEVIAIFDGCKFNVDGTVTNIEWKDKYGEGYEAYSKNILQLYLTYDWQMAVVAKIQSHLGRTTFKIHKDMFVFKVVIREYMKSVLLTGIGSNLELGLAIHEAIFDFIRLLKDYTGIATFEELQLKIPIQITELY